MNWILDRLEIWRKERGLDITQGFKFELNTQCSFVFEEIGVEYLRAKNEYEKIDALCDTIVYQINGLSLVYRGLENLLAAIQKSENETYKFKASDLLVSTSVCLSGDIDVLESFVINIIACKKEVENMYFDFNKCMEETLKEIESRKGAFNSDTGKWEKFKDEESQKLWYKANYESCKL